MQKLKLKQKKAAEEHAGITQGSGRKKAYSEKEKTTALNKKEVTAKKLEETKFTKEQYTQIVAKAAIKKDKTQSLLKSAIGKKTTAKANMDDAQKKHNKALEQKPTAFKAIKSRVNSFVRRR